MKEKGQAICGAKTRSGKPCKRSPTYQGRCHLHGGKSLPGIAHPNYKHGWYSKYSFRPAIIYLLNRQGYYCQSNAEYLELLKHQHETRKTAKERRAKEDNQSGENMEV